MDAITEGRNFRFNSLVSQFRRISLEDLSREFFRFTDPLREHGLVLPGPFIIQMLSGEAVNDAVLFNCMFYAPCTTNRALPELYTYINRLTLGKCVVIQFSGDYHALSEQHVLLFDYLHAHNLESISGIYHILESEDVFTEKFDRSFVDICVETRHFAHSA
jgi:hypothetical protein